MGQWAKEAMSSGGSGWRWPRRREKEEREGEVGEREGEGREKKEERKISNSGFRVFKTRI